jgi:uncharacterized NAD(P)/FAD-binding protein YdhS
MLAAHLAEEPSLRTILFERVTFARGLAYATKSPRHLLNLAAGKMSAFPDKPLDFVEWLGNDDAGAYVSRFKYADYLRSVFERATADAAHVALCSKAVVSIVPESEGFRIRLDDATTVRARAAVLALGLFPPSGEMVDAAARSSPHYIGDPWSLSFDALYGNVLLIGSGLTAIDVLLELRHRGHIRTVTMLSRHGLLPQPHAAYGEPVAGEPDRRSALKTFHWIRKAVAEAQQQGGDWRAVIDGIRPISQAIWQSWPLREQQRFLRHLRPYWDISRRRVPQEAYRVVKAMEEAGTLRRRNGRLRSVKADEDGKFNIEFEHSGERATLDADWIVNCTGPRGDVTKIEDPLVSSLLQQGLIAPHPTRIGIQAMPDGRVIGEDGRPSDNLFATGAFLRGVLYESISVTELSGQVKDLAQTLRARLA